MITALLKRKLYTLWHGLTVFDPYAYAQCRALSKRFPPRNLREDFRGQTVVCVGSGPSLDVVDISQVQDCTVLFLNSAFMRWEEFAGQNNKLLWLCVDRKRANALAEKVPDCIKKVVSTHEFKSVRQLARALRQNDVFLMPHPVLRRVDGRGLPNIRPVMPSSSDVKIEYSNWPNIDILPHTVMLNAIRLSMALGSCRILTMGFDLPAADSERHSQYAKGAAPPTGGAGFDQQNVERYLKRLCDEAMKVGGSIVNSSPLSEVTSLENVVFSDYSPKVSAKLPKPSCG